MSHNILYVYVFHKNPNSSSSSRVSHSLRRRHTGHLGRGSDICAAQTWHQSWKLEQPVLMFALFLMRSPLVSTIGKWMQMEHGIKHELCSLVFGEKWANCSKDSRKTYWALQVNLLVNYIERHVETVPPFLIPAGPHNWPNAHRARRPNEQVHLDTPGKAKGMPSVHTRVLHALQQSYTSRWSWLRICNMSSPTNTRKSMNIGW